ncbi:MAG TPA: amidohydrolase family protein [Gemmatimonadales bacterium]|nr:amidohydrolase family protein [Gemmatimonadales bacterium]
MNTAGRFLLALGPGLGAVLVGGAVRSQPSPGPAVALTHANVLDVEQGRILSDHTVLTLGGRIVSVSPSGPARWPAGTQVVNIAGRFVIPGLWDMHVHQQADAWYDSLHRQPAARREALTYFRALFLGAGVTGVREMGGDLAALRAGEREAEREGILRPRVVLTGEKLGRRPVVPGAPFPVRSGADVRQSTRLLRAAGGSHLKLAASLSPDLTRAALEDCRTERIQCSGHAPVGMSIADAAALGLASLEHLSGFPDETSSLGLERIASWRAQHARPTFLERVLFKLHLLSRPPEVGDTVLATYDSAKAVRLYRRMASAGTRVTPTLTLAEMILPAEPPDPVARDSSLLIVPLPQGFFGERSTAARDLAIRTRTRYREVIRGLRAAGVGLLAGTDAPLHAVPGFSLPGELVLLQEAGLTPLEALRTATLEPARYLNATDTLGSVAPGRVADLVVLRANPLADVRATREVEMVMTRGRLLRRRELDLLVRQGREALARVRVALGRTGAIGPR